jgi:hypothetical protein
MRRRCVTSRPAAVLCDDAAKLIDEAPGGWSPKSGAAAWRGVDLAVDDERFPEQLSQRQHVARPGRPGGTGRLHARGGPGAWSGCRARQGARTRSPGAATQLIGEGWAHARKFFSLSEKYAPWADYHTPARALASTPTRTRPNGRSGSPPGATGSSAVAELRRRGGPHPPMRRWLAVPLIGSDGENYGFIQASDRLEGDFTAQDEANLVRLASLTSTALDALAQLHLPEYRAKVGRRPGCTRAAGTGRSAPGTAAPPRDERAAQHPSSARAPPRPGVPPHWPTPRRQARASPHIAGGTVGLLATLSNVTMRNQAGHAGPPSPTTHIGEETEREPKIMTEQKPTVVLVHGACLVITEAAAGNESVVGLVDVNAFAPEHGEAHLSGRAASQAAPLGDALIAYPVSTGGEELVIKQEMFHHQFAADVPAAQAALMAATQRPVTAAARAEGLPTDAPGWRKIPSWFMVGDQDLNIPVAAHGFAAERAGSRGTREVAGARTRSACRIPTSLRHRFSTPPSLLLGKPHGDVSGCN